MKDDYQTFSMACLLLVLLLGFMYYVATPARSQDARPCLPKLEMDKKLWNQFGESPIGAGLADSGGILYLTTNPKTGSFTVLIRRPDGITCMMTGGRGWADIESLIPGRDL